MIFSNKRFKYSKDNVKADLEHLQKLFIMPDSPDKFVQFGNELLDLIHSFFSEKGGIHSEISPQELEKIFSNIDIPEDPHLFKDILQEIKQNVIKHSVKVGNPYYIGHMTSAIPYFMILLEMIVAALNQNQVKIETAKASTFLEREFIAWIHRLVFDFPVKYYKANIQNQRVALGVVTTDGTISNLTALLVARNRLFPPTSTFQGIAHAGVFAAYEYYNVERAVVLVSQRGHYSISKAARILGLGDDNIISIPVDSNNRLDLNAMENVCSQIEENNRKGGRQTRIMAIIGIAGTTETGNIDPLPALRQLADKYNAYFHVDAAWGGPVLLVDKYRYLFDGIDAADSVAFDAHKLLYCPMSMGLILFRDENDLDYVRHNSRYILRPDSLDLGKFTVEGSRPFNVLKPWVTLKIFGRDGFRLLFDHAFNLTAVLRGLVEVHPNFEGMNKPELFIIVYRFVPRPVQDKLRELKWEKMFNPDHLSEIEKEITSINEVLNELNVALHRAIRKEDNSFVSRTMIESTEYLPQLIVVLRAVMINPLTTPEILSEIIEEQNELGWKIYEQEFIDRFQL